MALPSVTIMAANICPMCSRGSSAFSVSRARLPLSVPLKGNGCAERNICTLKENLLWVRTFASVEELRLALLAFRKTTNATWLIERHGLRPPAAIRREQLPSVGEVA